MPKASVHRGGRPMREKKFKRGASIHDMVMAFNPETKEWEMPTVCFLNDAPILRTDWGKLRPCQEDKVIFAVLPLGGGGGSNPLQTILQVVLTVVAVWAGQAWAAAGLWGGAFVSAGVMIAGGLLLGSIFGTSATPTGHQGKLEDSSPTYSLGAANNVARMNQAEPEGFGYMKIMPDRVTYAWPIYIGNEQYIHQVFALGRGTYDIKTLMFGDSIIWSKDKGIDTAYDVEVEICEPGQPVTLFPDNVEISGEVSGQQLYAMNDPEYTGWIGPFSANPPGTYTNRIVNNVIFPQGVGRFSDNGGLGGARIDLLFEYQRIDDYGNPIGGWGTLAQESVIMATQTAQRISIDKPVTEGRYQVRARRTLNANLDGRTLHMTQWETLESFLPGSLTYEQSVIAVKAKATNILSQQAANRFSVIYTRKLPVWNIDTQKWSAPVPTRNFAAAVSQVVRAEYGGNLPDNRLDLDALWRIGNQLEKDGMTFDGYFDGYYTIWPLVMEMCQPFGVVPRLSSGILSFVADIPNRPVRHIFTPENIVRGSFSITYNTFTDQTPDDVSIEYLDEDAGFQRRDVQAVLPDSESRSTATRNVIGVVNRSQAFYMGVGMAARNRHRRLEFKWQTEGVGRLISMGDVASINHPFFAVAQTGVLQDWDEASLTFALNREVTWSEGEDIYLAMNGRNGSPWGPCKVESVSGNTIKMDAADYALILSQYEAAGRIDGNPFSWASNGQGAYPTIWKIENGPSYEGRVIIKSVRVVDRFHYEITAMNDAPEAYGYKDLPVPPWRYRNHYSTETDLVAPANIAVRVEGNQAEPVLLLTWVPVPGASSYVVEHSTDNVSWQMSPEVFLNEFRLSVEPGFVFVRISAKNSQKQGPWGTWEDHTDNLFTPAAILELAQPYLKADLKVTWTAPTFPVNQPIKQFSLEIFPQGAGIAARQAELAGTARSYDYSPAMGLADGGPWRDLSIRLEMKTYTGVSRYSVLNVSDSPPPAPTAVQYTVAANSIALNSVTMEPDIEHSGFVIVRGASPDFGLDDFLEMKTSRTLPFTWSGLTPNTTYYFRIAAKDAFYDIAADHLALKYSDVLAITTLVV